MGELFILKAFLVLILVMAVVPVHAEVASQSALKRLQEKYSLERVTRDHFEVGWNELEGLQTVFTQRVPVQTRTHPDVIFVHPDLSISLGRDQDSLGIGFALGETPQLPDMYKVTRRLHKGYQPVVESEWRCGNIKVSQTAFAILPTDKEVVTGREVQYLVVRMVLTNSFKSAETTALVVPIGRMLGSQCTNYQPFTAPIERWQAEQIKVRVDGRSVLID